MQLLKVLQRVENGKSHGMIVQIRLGGKHGKHNLMTAAIHYEGNNVTSVNAFAALRVAVVVLPIISLINVLVLIITGSAG